MNLDEIAARGAVLALVAHPDDESFGLGAILAALATAGAEVRVLCLTHGEASTLGSCGDLAAVRRRELAAAATALGLAGVELHDFPDGGLTGVPAGDLDAVVARALLAGSPVRTLVAFEPGGVTGHPDHCAATAAAWRAADRWGLPVLEWGVAPDVASALNAELGTTFTMLDGDGADDIAVDRAPQRAAIACHQSQARDNPVLTRRLQLAGGMERVRWRDPAPAPARMA